MHLVMCMMNNLSFAERVWSLYWILQKWGSTKEWTKLVHTISQVFVPNFVFGVYITRYNFHFIHSPINVRLPIRVIWEANPVPTLLTWRPPSSLLIQVSSEHSLHTLEYNIALNTLYLPVPHLGCPPKLPSPVSYEWKTKTKNKGLVH